MFCFALFSVWFNINTCVQRMWFAFHTLLLLCYLVLYELDCRWFLFFSFIIFFSFHFAILYAIYFLLFLLLHLAHLFITRKMNRHVKRSAKIWFFFFLSLHILFCFWGMDSFCNVLKTSGRETKKKNSYEWERYEYERKILRKIIYSKTLTQILKHKTASGTNTMSKRTKTDKNDSMRSWKPIEQRCYK